MHLQSILGLMLLLTIYLRQIQCIGVDPENTKTSADREDKQIKSEPVVTINLNNANETHKKQLTASTVIPINNATNIVTQNKDSIIYSPSDLIQSGAIERGFYVFLGATVLLLMFLGFRMYRLRSGAPRPNVMVKKYGVVTNRSDVEMLPLPLDEDDEDDTVFDVNHSVQGLR